jgi:hypothetical protein
VWIIIVKVEEKRESSYPLKLRKPGEREDKNISGCFDVLKQKRRNSYSIKLRKPWRRENRKEGNFSPPPFDLLDELYSANSMTTRLSSKTLNRRVVHSSGVSLLPRRALWAALLLGGGLLAGWLGGAGSKIPSVDVAKLFLPEFCSLFFGSELPEGVFAFHRVL